MKTFTIVKLLLLQLQGQPRRTQSYEEAWLGMTKWVFTREVSVEMEFHTKDKHERPTCNRASRNGEKMFLIAEPMMVAVEVCAVGIGDQC